MHRKHLIHSGSLVCEIQDWTLAILVLNQRFAIDRRLVLLSCSSEDQKASHVEWYSMKVGCACLMLQRLVWLLPKYRTLEQGRKIEVPSAPAR